jgi:hypothetical protein
VVAEKITPAVRGTLFPPQKTKNPFSGGHQKNPCQHRGFPVSERFGKKKIQEFYKKKFYSVLTINTHPAVKRSYFTPDAAVN